MLRRRRLYPFVGASYPVLALFSANALEGVRFADLLTPIAGTFFVVASAWLLARLVTRDPDRQALCALLFGLWFNTYGAATAMADRSRALSVFADDRVIFPGSLLVLVVLCVAVVRSSAALRTTAGSLNLVTCLVLVIPALAYARAQGAPAPVWQPDGILAPRQGETWPERPSIYYIVLDSYTGSRSLERNYGFDNEEFESFLRERGFFVPRQSRSNYVMTFLTLASALNWEHLDWLPARAGFRSTDPRIPYAMIEDSRTSRLLKRLGYRFVFFPSPFAMTAHNRLADELVPDRERHGVPERSPFAVTWMLATPVRPVFAGWCAPAGCRGEVLPYTPESPELTLWKLDELGELASRPGPRFVFAHMPVPHDPYVFRADCSTRPPRWPSRRDAAEDRWLREAYVEQIRCLNSRLEKTVERILRESRVPPIILLQSDHGSGRFEYPRPPEIRHVLPDQLEERLDIFAAYHLPHGGEALMYDSITPVNVLPAVLRHYFGAPIEPLEDRSYYSSWKHPYRFTRIP